MAALTATPVGGGPGPQASNLPGTFLSSKLIPKVIQLNAKDGSFKLVGLNDSMQEGGRHIQTKKCGKNCLCCQHINGNEFIHSVAMNRRYVPIVPIDSDLACRTFSVIYIVTCRKCGMQYIGQTSRALKDRVLEHRRSIIKGSLDTYLTKHFRTAGHTVDDFSVQIAEVVTDKKDLCIRELFWIKLLNTAYPCGLNDSIAGFGNISEGADPLIKKEQPYFTMRYSTKVRTNNAKKRRASHKLNNQVIDDLSMVLANSSYGYVNQIIVYLRKQSQKTLRMCHAYTSRTDGSCDPILKLMLTAFLAGYYSHKLGPNKAKKLPVDRFIMKFSSSVIDDLKINSIFKMSQVKRVNPVPVTSRRRVEVVFTYERPFSTLVFNYSKELRRISDSSMLGNMLNRPCNCQGSAFLYAPFGHIVTGNLNMVQNNDLRLILAKGSKYRMPNYSTTNIANCFISSLDKLIMKIATRSRILLRHFNDWRQEILKVLYKRIDQYAFTSQHNNGAVSASILAALHRLQRDFIIAPADKSAGNYVFICKKFYFLTICQELGISVQSGCYKVDGNDVYAVCKQDRLSIQRRHSMQATYFGIGVQQLHVNLPNLFAIPKLHKSPYKFRFIAGAHAASTKDLSIVLHKILVHLRSHFRNYCNKILVQQGRRCFWSINDSLTLLERIKRFGNVSHVITADFSNMFTNLPHATIKFYMHKLISLCFKNSKRRLVGIGHTNVFYADEATYPSCRYFTEVDLKEMVEIIVDETFVAFSGFVFKQVKGVPMGGNASPMIADLTLAMMEYEFAKDKQNPSILAARYIDDIFVANYQQFLAYVVKIYGSDLHLDVTSNGHVCNFLDLHIQLTTTQRLPLVTIYNKTDAFPFKVNRYSYPDSRVSIKVHSVIILTQLIRFARIITQYHEFMLKCKQLFQ
ncbi:GIY-YIG nuclease family protein, partial [Pseudoalteromonas sp.]|uniref:GIY-YIG nuclease family protein n=1 Tax=Pseudoalteromonas sp. TaxID=53249 RepID=UPI00262BF040